MRSHACGGGCAEGGPLPVVVLRIEQEVGAHNGHAHCDDRQNDEHQQHEAVHIVHLQQAGQHFQACQPRKAISELYGVRARICCGAARSGAIISAQSCVKGKLLQRTAKKLVAAHSDAAMPKLFGVLTQACMCQGAGGNGPQRYLVVPERCEDEVHLNEDGPEGQQAPHESNHSRPEVPLPFRDGGGDPLHPAGVVRQPVPVAPYHLCMHR